MAAVAATAGYGYGGAYDGNAARKLRPEREVNPAAPRFKVHEGKGLSAKRTALAPLIHTILATAIVTVAVCVIICIARVALCAMTVQTLKASSDVTANIADARTQGATLEAQHAVAASSVRVQQEATALGMSEDTSPETLDSQTEFTDGALDTPAAKQTTKK